MQPVGDALHQRHGVGFLAEAEAHLGQRLQLVEAPAGKAFFAHHLDGAEQHLADLADVVHAFPGQVDADIQQPLAGIHRIRAHPQAAGPAAVLEQREQRTLALVTENVGDLVNGLLAVVIEGTRHREGKGHRAQCLQRRHLEHQRQILVTEQRCLGDEAAGVAATHRVEALAHPVLELVEGLAADYRQRHQVGGVVGAVEIHQVLAHRVALAVGQGLDTAHREVAARMRRVHRLPTRGQHAPALLVGTGGILRIDDDPLATYQLLVEQRRDEELAEAVQRVFQELRAHGKEVVGVVVGGPGIVAAAVVLDEGLVFPGLGIFLGAEKEHVLQEVRQSLAVGGIVAMAHGDVQRGGRLVRRRVRHEHHLHAVVETQVAVLAVVELAGDQFGCQRAAGQQRDQQQDQRHRWQVPRQARECFHREVRRAVNHRPVSGQEQAGEKTTTSSANRGVTGS